jgi:hypothetical protein
LNNVQESCEQWIEALKQVNVLVIEDLEIKGIEDFDQLVKGCRQDLELLKFLWKHKLFTVQDLKRRRLDLEHFLTLYEFMSGNQKLGLLAVAIKDIH